ncbi:MAG TPA: DUF5017 domain-containing protein [Bacteroides reticulotermitis]|nr:DUF5017 domain-containing protein [Bacteroides reticulotermitis]
MKRYLYLLLIATGGLLVSCDSEKVDDVDFDVTISNNLKEIYVEDDVTFEFSGNPAYIVFYSGESGHEYAYKDRLRVDVESMRFSYTITQQYTDDIFQNKETMQIYISEDFNGDYTPEGMKKATWTKLSGTGEGELKVPLCDNKRKEEVMENTDFSVYKDKKFYLGIRYETTDVASGWPRVDVTSMNLEKVIPGGTVPMTNPSKGFGFNFVYLDSKDGNFWADDVKLLFQPKSEKEGTYDVWAVSQQIDVAAVAPDMGVPVKSLDMKSPSYTYNYTEPGEYKVTFVALNANAWNTKSVMKEMKVVVKERID